LQRVAEALFGMEQQDFLAERRAIPPGLQEPRQLPRRLGQAPAPLVFRPAFLEAAGQQQSHGEIDTRLGVIGLEA
jgi:hypothetical protein